MSSLDPNPSTGPEFVIRQEEGPIPICRQCGHHNELGGEVFDTIKCEACNASIWGSNEVRYLPCCPICGVSLEEVDPSSTYTNESGISFWTCDNCGDEPRAIFLHEQWMGDEIGPCAVCGGPSTLLTFGNDDSGDGEGLCDQCAEKPEGQAKISRHWEEIAGGDEE